MDVPLDSLNLLKLGCLILEEGFQRTLIFAFFMFDYMTKIRMRGYNARKIVGVSKLQHKLTAGEVSKANI